MAYDELLIEVSKKTILIWVKQVQEMVLERNIAENNVCIVSAPFDAVHYTKDGR